MEIPIIRHDFNDMGGDSTSYFLPLKSITGEDALWWWGIIPKAGMKIHLYDVDLDDDGNRDDLVADATIAFDEQNQQWYAVIPHAALGHCSEFKGDPMHWTNLVDWGAVHRREHELYERFVNRAAS
jgi:hypothetical protein